MKQLILSLIFIMPISASAGCFTEHLNEAIAVNKARKNLYSKLTNGRSNIISNQLIFGEKTSKLAAKYFDYKARPYKARGIPLFCKDFVSMNLISDFQELDNNPEPIGYYKMPNGYKIKTKLHNAYYSGGFKKLEEVALKEYLKLKPIKTYHSMTKHVLESVVHSARLAPEYIRQAADKNMVNPKKLIWRFMKTIIFSIPYSVNLDAKAAPLQAEGYLIITQDVPRIIED